MSDKSKWQRVLRKLWYTDCEYCQRVRLLLVWGLLMLPLVLWWITD